MEWAWAYFGGPLEDVILDRPEELQINWNEDSEEAAGAAPVASSEARKAS